MNLKHEQFLYGSMLCILNAAMSRAKESAQKGFIQFAEVHRENAIGAYTMWVSIAHEDFIKKYQDSLLDAIYE